MLGIFPMAYTFFCVFIFVSPITKLARVVNDSQVYHWIGEAPQVVVWLPVIFIVFAHILHRQRRGPNRLAVIISLIGSSVVLLILSHTVMTRSVILGSQFFSTDCTSFGEKAALERSWQAARTFQAGCGASSDSGFGSLVSHCPGYSRELISNPSWAYLESLERRFACGGLCTSDRQLWSYHGAHEADSCAVALGGMMQWDVRRQSMQVMVYSIFVLALTTIYMLMLGPKTWDVHFTV